MAEQKENNVIATEYVNNYSEEKVSNKWWLQPSEQLHKSVNSVTTAIEETQVYQFTSRLRNARLYHNLELLGFNPHAHTRVQELPSMTNRVTLNVIKSCIDTLTAKLAKNKPRPMFLTFDGDWTMQTKAKKLSMYLDGVFTDAKVYKHGKRVFKDSGIFGTGCLKVFRYNNKPAVERVLLTEILVDEAEGLYGEPRQLHQTQYIDREVLIDQFPKFKHEILSAKTAEKSISTAHNVSDLIVVKESWHLRSGEEAKDGVRAVTIDGATLVKEEWDKDYFPFVFLHYTERVVGFWGQGLAEELTGLQLEINKLLRNIQLAMHLISNPRVLLDNNSVVNINHINNEIAGILKYTGTPPAFITPTAVNPEVYQHLENLYKKAYEISGISQLSAQSQKPAGLNSGKALREFTDIESERFQIMGQAYEQMYLDIATMLIDVARDIYKDTKELNVKSVNGKFVETIDWKDIDLDNESYVMRVFPTSLLSQTPAGKMADVQELVQAGFIEKEQAMELLDFPDVEAFQSLETSGIGIVKKYLELMAEKGIYNTPEAYMPLQKAVVMAQNAYNKYKMNGLDEERLQLIRTFIDECNDLLTPEQPTQPIAQDAGAMPPMAAPVQAPISQIMPIQGGQ